MKLIFTIPKRYFMAFMSLVVIGVGVMMELYINWAGWIKNANSAVNNPGVLPNIVAIALIAVGAAMMLQIASLPKGESYTFNLSGVIMLLIWWFFAIIMPYTGFIPGGILALAASLLLWENRNPVKIACVSILTPITVYFILGYLMKVNFPKGFLGF